MRLPEQSSALQALEAIYAVSPDIKLFCEDGPSSLLRVVLTLMLRTRATERSGLMLVARPVLASIALTLCTLLVDLRPGLRSSAESGTQLAGTATTMQPVSSQAFCKKPFLRQALSLTKIIEEFTCFASPFAGPAPPVPANDASLNPQEQALTTSLVFFSLMELLFDSGEASSLVADECKAQHEAFQTPASTVEMAIQVSQTLIDIYEYLQPRFASLEGKANAKSAEFPFDSSAARAPLEVTGQAGLEPRTFFLGVIGTMAVSVGALGLQGVDQKRWRFVSNPAAALQPAQAGGFASAARQLLSHYKQVKSGLALHRFVFLTTVATALQLFKTCAVPTLCSVQIQYEGCQIVKKLAGLVILRSEQAAGMVLRAGKQSS